MSRLRIGVFVGGRGSRLGGLAKGLLRNDGQTLIARLLEQCRRALPNTPISLVGEAAAYAPGEFGVLADAPPGHGPLGGLRALLLACRENGEDAALALACDLPYVDAAFIERLARDQPDAWALAPHDGQRWFPLCSRYGTAALTAVELVLRSERHALQSVFQALGERARPLAMTPSDFALLRDWDRPEDVAADGGELPEADAADAPVR